MLLLLGLVETAMLVRAVLSWFIMEEGNVFMTVLVFVTEPFITPLRFLLSRFRFVNECPIDIPYMATFFVLSFLQLFLPVPTL